MKIIVFCALIFGLESVFAQTVTIQPYYTSPVNNSVVFAPKKQLALYCNVTVVGAQDPNESLTVQWKKDGKSVTEVDSLKNRFKLSNVGNNYSLSIGEAYDGDVGNWSCHAFIGAQDKADAPIQVVTTIAIKIKTDSINVVEEEKLRIECSVSGNPPPALSWRIETYKYNGTTGFDERVKILDYTDEHGVFVENGALVIEKVDKEDRGMYYCMGVNKYWDQNWEETKSMIRVKDKYAALWPFLGICAEVIVLCAVIIIYEKKRNKTELEESDTDQSPDQKNTPDHGKDANLRHRQ